MAGQWRASCDSARSGAYKRLNVNVECERWIFEIHNPFCHCPSSTPGIESYCLTALCSKLQTAVQRSYLSFMCLASVDHIRTSHSQSTARIYFLAFIFNDATFGLNACRCRLPWDRTSGTYPVLNESVRAERVPLVILLTALLRGCSRLPSCGRTCHPCYGRSCYHPYDRTYHPSRTRSRRPSCDRTQHRYT